MMVPSLILENDTSVLHLLENDTLPPSPHFLKGGVHIQNKNFH
jgi:hypothetical protein